MPISISVSRNEGQEPSPTPIEDTEGDSINVIWNVDFSLDANTPAANQPAVPPPTTTMCLTLRSSFNCVITIQYIVSFVFRFWQKNPLTRNLNTLAGITLPFIICRNHSTN